MPEGDDAHGRQIAFRPVQTKHGRHICNIAAVNPLYRVGKPHCSYDDDGALTERCRRYTMPPLNLLIKPASGRCNLRCGYCFYKDEMDNRSCPEYGPMSMETMRILVDKALAYGDGTCVFGFQGGEPTLRGLDFYRAFAAYVQAHANPKHLRIQYTMQTNGILIDDAWAEWFAQNQVLVGISLDGPEEIHDRYRTDRSGNGTFQQVLRAIHTLDRYHVDYNVLTVVTAETAQNAQQVYNFMKAHNISYQQYIECLDPLGEPQGIRPYSLTPQHYETFLKDLFDVWYLDIQSGRYVYNRYFENLLMMMDGQCPESCNQRGVCGSQWVLEADGSVYPCDFYVLDQWRLGNIHTDSFEQMEHIPKASGFTARSIPLPKACLSCRWYQLCRNGCYRLRQPEKAGCRKNYFCQAYQNFLDYAYPRLEELYRRIPF